QANRYCGNGLAPAMWNFGLNSQTHGVTGNNQPFRYGLGARYTIDTSADPLANLPYDLDHPATDPRPGSALGNVLRIDGVVIPEGQHVSKPPHVGVTPTLSLNGANPLVLECGAAFSDPGAGANDLCEGDLTAEVTASGAVDAGAPDSYAIL